MLHARFSPLGAYICMGCTPFCHLQCEIIENSIAREKTNRMIHLHIKIVRVARGARPWRAERARRRKQGAERPGRGAPP